MKNIILLALVGLFAIQALCLAESKSTLSFSWALLHRDNNGTLSSLDSENNPTVHSGDALRIMIHPKTAFVYLYYQDASGDLSLIYPNPVTNHKLGTMSYIPSDKDWYEFDQHTGMETLHLLASNKRLLDLEEITNNYLCAEPGHKDELKLGVIAEIKKIRKANSSLSTPAEKPVSIIGSFRGKSNIETMATEVSAESFYGKTIRIDHK